MFTEAKKILEQKKSKQYSAKDIVNAIEQVESSGGVNTMGKSGEKGALQFMPNIWKEYSEAYLKAQGKSGVLPQTYENQRKVAEFKIQSWMNQGFDTEQLAAAWNAGPQKAVTGEWKKMIGVNKYGIKYDTPSYVNKFLNILNTNNETTKNSSTVTSKEWRNPMENIPIIGKPVATLGNLGASVIHGTARSGATFVMEYKNALAETLGLGQVDEEISFPKDTIVGKYQRLIFGEEPIRTISAEGKALSKTLTDFGLDEGLSNKIGIPLAGAFVALDFTGVGGEAKGALKAIIKSKTIKEAETLLKELKVPTDVAKNYVEPIINAKNTKEAKAILDSMDNILKETKVSNLEKTTKVSKSIIDNEAILFNEAKKYKSAEEFVNSFVQHATDVPEKIRGGNIEKGMLASNVAEDIASKNPSYFYKTPNGKVFVGKNSGEIKSIFLVKKSDVKGLKNIGGITRGEGQLGLKPVAEFPVGTNVKSELTNIWNKANNKLSNISNGAEELNGIVKLPSKTIDNGVVKLVDDGGEVFIDSKVNQELAQILENEKADMSIRELEALTDEALVESKNFGKTLSEGKIPALSSKALKSLPQEIKTSVEKTIILSSKLKNVLNSSKDAVEDALSKIWGELEISEAGKRIFINEGQQGGVKVIAQHSTFPDWVPSELRSKKLFNRTMRYLTTIDTIAFPAKATKKQIRLLDVIFDKIDSMTGINTQFARKQLFNEIKQGGFKNIKKAVQKNQQIKNQMLKRLNSISRQANKSMGLMTNEQLAQRQYLKYDRVEDIYRQGKTINKARIKHTKEFEELSEYLSKEDIKKNIDDFDKLPRFGGKPVAGVGKLMQSAKSQMFQTPSRVAEGIDGGIGGFFNKKIIKPVQQAETKMMQELRVRNDEIKTFKVLDGSKDDIASSLYAQKQWNEPISQNAKKFAEYARKEYDDLLDRMNIIREKLGEPLIKKRADYVTHLNEMNILNGMGMFGSGMSKRLDDTIKELKELHIDDTVAWTDTRIRNAAIRKIEKEVGSHGELARYFDPNSAPFKFAKERMSELEQSPSLISSLEAYLNSSMEYIYQAENFVKNKAFIDALPPGNAKDYLMKWNKESVAGFTPTLLIGKNSVQILNKLRTQIGSNMMLGSLSTALLQLTSVAQVIAHAGVKNTAIGYAKRIASFLGDKKSFFPISQTKAERDIGLDIGLGKDFADDFLKMVGDVTKAKDQTSKMRNAIKLGKDLWSKILKANDQLTVGATWEAFYRQGVVDKGYNAAKAMEYADVLTGKTQARYLKTELPSMYNIAEGRIAGQFGIYTINQFQSLLHDTGKVFGIGEKSVRKNKTVAQQLFKYMVAAYAIDAISDKVMGRSPYEIKPMADSIYGAMTGDSSWGEAMTTTRDSFANYIPFISSAKYGSLPPVAELGKDVTGSLFGSGDEQDKSWNNILTKWSLLLTLPFGGNQIKKTLEGMESAYGIDIPVISDKSETKAGKDKYKFDSDWQKMKALLFGPASTEGAKEYYHDLDFPENKSLKKIVIPKRTKSKKRSVPKP